MIAWREGDPAHGAAVRELMDKMRDAEILFWDDDAKRITLCLSAPHLDDVDDEEDDDDLDPARPPVVAAATAPPSAPGASPRETSRPSGHAATMKRARFYFKRRERQWRNVPVDVSFEAWLASRDGLAWQRKQGLIGDDDAGRNQGGTGSAEPPGTAAEPGGTGRNRRGTPPSPEPSPSEKEEEKREEKRGDSDARPGGTVTEPAEPPKAEPPRNRGGTGSAEPARVPAVPVVAAPPPPRSNPLEVLSEASKGVVRPMGGAASLITGPGELRDQLAELFVGDDELRAWGADLATEEGRKASWPDRSWTAGDLKVIGPIVTGKRSITLDWLRKASFNGRPWEFLRNGIEDWRKSRADRTASRTASERPAAREAPGGREAQAPGAQRLPSDRVAALAGEVLKQGFKAQRSVGR